MTILPGDKGTCPVCKEQITVTRYSGLRRHNGVDEFDLETDGICSGSNGVPLEESSSKG